MNQKIIIYAEGGFRLGLGNIYRSLSLASAIHLKDRDREILFVTSSDDYVQQIIKNKGYALIALETQEQVFSWIENEKPELVIIDYLGISKDYVQSVREKGIKVVIIGNDSDANLFANLVVNAIIGTDFTNTIKVCNQTKYLEGPRYLVLRDEFVRKRNSYVYKGDLRTIGLLFGGTDQANLSCKILLELIRAKVELNVILVLGAGFKFEAMLNTIMSENECLKINVLHNISNVSEILLQMDFLITSPGTALFEAFCLGIPAIAFFQSESQEYVFGDFFMTKRYELVSNLLDEVKKTYYQDMDMYREKLRSLQVGQGKDEIIDNILNL